MSFYVKALIYFWVGFPPPPPSSTKESYGDLWETSIDQVQANCSIEVKEQKGTVTSSNKFLTKVERGKKRALIMVNNR